MRRKSVPVKGRILLTVLIAVVGLAFAGTAGATSSYDPITGTGVVEASDVQ
jgi:hypothetical protein